MNAHWVKGFSPPALYTVECILLSTVFRQGDIGTSWYAVLSGSLDVKVSETANHQVRSVWDRLQPHTYVITCVVSLVLLCVSCVRFALNHLNHKWMNEWIMYWVLNHRHYGVHSVISSLFLWGRVIFLGCHFLTTSCTIFIVTSSVEDPGLALQVLLMLESRLWTTLLNADIVLAH